MESINELSFINPNKNDKFSYLRGLDLQELIIQIENFYLIYRDSLNLPNNLSFGIELEYEKVSKSSVDKYVDKNIWRWESKRDGSLSSGGEVVSPVLYDRYSTWTELQKICNY